MKFTILSAALFMAGYASAVPVIAPASFAEGTVAPLVVPTGTEAVKGSYIIVLKDKLTPVQIQNHNEWINSVTASASLKRGEFLTNGGKEGIQHSFNLPSLKGYSGKFDKQVIDAIRKSSEVAYVEEDSVVYASELQRGAPWGLARISTRAKLGLTGYDQYNYDATTAGAGVKVYVIDTGINIKHNDLEGRATWGKTIPLNDSDTDGNGHGSHCSGTIAGKTYGVAKKALPVAVKVLASNGSGSMSDVLAGVEWATSDYLKDKKAGGAKFKGAAANMSLGGGKSPSLDAAVNGAVDAGIVFAVAAGNDNADACNYSPARAEKAISVGASTLQDTRATFSNYGNCVDIFAPGKDIPSIWMGSNTATNIISGTSMASPHVAGLAAYFISQYSTEQSPAVIKQKIYDLATKNALTPALPAGTPNLLAYNGFK